MKNIRLILIPFTLFTACKPTHKNIPAKDSTTNSVHVLSATDKQPAIVVKDFLKWYRDNMDTLYKIKTIDGGPAGISTDESARNYFVNFKEVNKYLSAFKKANFVSDKFIARAKQAFIQADSSFTKHPVNDGPPDGFDYDHILLTQEDYTKDLTNLDDIQFVALQPTSNAAEVEFSFPVCGMTYKYLLTKEKSGWLIDEIKNESGPVLRSELSLISCQ